MYWSHAKVCLELCPSTTLRRIELTLEKSTHEKKKIATRPRIRIGDSNLVKRPQPLSLVSSAVGWDAVMDGWSITPGDILFLDCPSPR